MTDAIDPFAPLPGGTTSPGKSATPKATPIFPVPDSAPTCDFVHPTLGKPAALWSYRDAAGRLLFHVARFETTGEHGEPKKEIMPLAYCQTGSRTGWRGVAPPAPRPLYGLAQLAARQAAPVLITEGEKAADAAAVLFPDFVAITSPSGSKAAGKADWSPLKGRQVTIWPDADSPGRDYAKDVARLASAAGAASVAIVAIPPDWPTGWDLADALPPHVTAADLESRLRSAPPFETPPAAASIEDTRAADGPYRLDDKGLWFINPDPSRGGRQWLTAPLDVTAETRDATGADWGLLLEWRDRDGRAHAWSMPSALLAGDGAELRRELLSRGLRISANREARSRLLDYLSNVRRPERIRAVSRIGWIKDAFVLPNAVIGQTGSERVVLQTERPLEHSFKTAGTLDGWRDGVAAPAAGNPALVLAIGAAFAAPLLTPLGLEGGGFHFTGASSIGKSTALSVAGSIWGGGTGRGYVRPWRTTDNGLEGVAAAHNDALLCLDEIGELDPRAAAPAAYMLANGMGKARAGRAGEGRSIAEWRVLFLSTGELSIADKIAEAGPRSRQAAGQAVRILDLPADAKRGHGLFEELHEHPSADAFARSLKKAADLHYGHPARAFLEIVAADREAIIAACRDQMARFLERHAPPGADGQVLRAGQRFALVAAAGEVATAAGVLPWQKGEATRGAAAMFRRWIDQRGGVGPAELRDGIELLRSFLFANGMSRFEPAWEGRFREIEGRLSEMITRDRAGFRRLDASAVPDDHATPDDYATEEPATLYWDFYIDPATWSAVLRGCDPAAIGREMARQGWLAVDDDKHLSKPVRVPGIGRPRLYHVKAAFLGGGP